jgi:hypothetical protein
LDVLPRVERPTDLRQRDPDDRLIEADDQRADEDDAESSPPFVGGRGRRSQSFSSTTIS